MAEGVYFFCALSLAELHAITQVYCSCSNYVQCRSIWATTQWPWLKGPQAYTVTLANLKLVLRIVPAVETVFTDYFFVLATMQCCRCFYYGQHIATLIGHDCTSLIFKKKLNLGQQKLLLLVGRNHYSVSNVVQFLTRKGDIARNT